MLINCMEFREQPRWNVNAADDNDNPNQTNLNRNLSNFEIIRINLQKVRSRTANANDVTNVFATVSGVLHNSGSVPWTSREQRTTAAFVIE